jgi:putative Mg2+ transporter-C (MgtC) family protein
MEQLAPYAPQLRVLLDVALAMMLGGLVGWEREAADKPAGLRTHMLIAGSAALFVGLGDALLVHLGEPTGRELIQGDPIRIIQAVVAGVAFLGAGTIIRGSKGQVEGLTTAASLLFTAALGVAVAVEQYVVAAGATRLLLVTLRVLTGLEAKIKGRKG